MAFWKKSDDPWDRKPEKRKETVWYEQDVPDAESTQPEEESLGESVRKFFLGDDTPIPPEPCPWCGKEMEWGRLTGGRDGVHWKNWRPRGLLDIVKPDGWKVLDLLDTHPKTVWLCSDCGKMVLDAPREVDYVTAWEKGEKPTLQQDGQVWGANPKAYEDYKSQWETKEGE